ncbi:MAG: hypothetical protein GXP52_01845 [Deltaproteobacteria bacterium]|nr:hypothetical protein [Deltaproteobacteria bacterium]
MISNRKVLLSLFIILFSFQYIFPVFSRAVGLENYVTSTACKECHEKIYNQWKKTPHARMLRNAFKDPSAIEATGFGPDIPFKKSDIYFTIGSHWIQKYLTLLGGQFYVLPKYWNIAEAKWEPYSIWNWKQNPYPITCNGCHAVGFDPQTRSYAEESITCEACHGPGSKHVEAGGDPALIVNPAKLDKRHRDMICEACHTDGKDKKTRSFPFPVGFKPGDDLTDYYTDFFMPKPKSKGWYWGDMSYKERHRMFMYWQTKFYATDRACDICGFDRGITVSEHRMMSRSEYCGTCHRKIYPAYEEHSMHTEAQAECADCHVPTVTDNGDRYSIHDHKFDFSRPAMPCIECHDSDMDGQNPPSGSHNFNINEVSIKENLTVPQACARCHEDKDEAWISAGIKTIKAR